MASKARQWLTRSLILVILCTGIGAKGADRILPCLCNELDKNAPDWRLYLRAKDTSTWQVLGNSTWAVIKINRPSGRFSLEAQGLMPQKEYALVRVTGQAASGQVLARAYADARGIMSCSGVWHEWSEKFWLVLGEDLRGAPADFQPGGSDTLINWQPDHYLFESEQL